ncbi:MAG: hypothetical protein ACOC8F_03160 [Planctomycetota bacterium]
MKNATAYRKKLKTLLKDMPGDVSLPDPDQREEPARAFVRAVLEADAADKHADKAVEALEKEFVDYNEMRVALPRELIECIGKDYPGARAKAGRIHEVLTNIFQRFNRVSLEPVSDLPRTELRRRLREMGMGPYEEGVVASVAFGIPTVPVDETLAGCLAMDEYIEPGSEPDEVQRFLERTVSRKDMPATHALLRDYVRKRAKALARRREKAAEAARAEAERQAAEAEQAEKAAKKRAKKAAAKSGKRKKAKKARKTRTSGTKAKASGGKRTRKSSSRKKTRSTRKTSKASPRKASKKASKKRSSRGGGSRSGKSAGTKTRKSSSKPGGKKSASRKKRTTRKKRSSRKKS